jgi:predicted NBD/HSP70 family sugar kinase
MSPHRRSQHGPRQAIGGTQEDVRRHNLATMLAHLHVAGPLRRADLTGLMGLNRSTIAALVTELAALGAVREERPEGTQAGAGRPSLVVRPRADRVQVLAADVGVGRVSVALVGLGGVVVARRSRRVDAPSPEAVVRLLSGAVRSLLADPAAGLVVGFGVSVPGVIRQQDGNVRFAPNLGWEDVPLGDRLGERVPHLPVRVGNDADLGALAEHRRGAARGVDDVVFVAGEEGVGCGLIFGGRPMLGAGGYAGELGHMTIRPDGRRCRCGARGCWETEIGAEAVRRALGRPEPLTADALGKVLRRADPDDLRSLAVVGEALGVGLANVVNLLNPTLVILGAMLAQLYPAVEGPVREALGRAVLRAPGEQVRLTVPELGADAVLLGAAELAWQDLLADPAGVLTASVVAAAATGGPAAAVGTPEAG